MSKRRVVVASCILFSLFFVCGCATVGNESLRSESESSVKEKIIEGKTTKDEVRKIFGSPLQTSYTDNGLEIWKYELSKVSVDAASFVPVVNIFASSASGTKKELTILFDEKNKVKKYNMSESPITQRTGLLNQ